MQHFSYTWEGLNVECLLGEKLGKRKRLVL